MWLPPQPVREQNVWEQPNLLVPHTASTNRAAHSKYKPTDRLSHLGSELQHPAASRKHTPLGTPNMAVHQTAAQDGCCCSEMTISTMITCNQRNRHYSPPSKPKPLQTKSHIATRCQGSFLRTTNTKTKPKDTLTHDSQGPSLCLLWSKLLGVKLIPLLVGPEARLAAASSPAQKFGQRQVRKVVTQTRQCSS